MYFPCSQVDFVLEVQTKVICSKGPWSNVCIWKRLKGLPCPFKSPLKWLMTKHITNYQEFLTDKTEDFSWVLAKFFSLSI